MTTGDYIKEKLRAFGVTEAQLLDVFIGKDFSPEEDVTSENMNSVGLAIVGLVEELVHAPYQSNINENGFSMSWDFSGMGKYYLWLCRRYGAKPSQDTLESLGVSMIIDKSDCW